MSHLRPILLVTCSFFMPNPIFISYILSHDEFVCPEITLTNSIITLNRGFRSKHLCSYHSFQLFVCGFYHVNLSYINKILINKYIN